MHDDLTKQDIAKMVSSLTATGGWSAVPELEEAGLRTRAFRRSERKL